MSSSVESIARAPSIAPPARTCGIQSPDLRKIFSMVRTIVPKPHGKWLQTATGAAPRTVEYWMQGRYQPRGAEALAIVRALREQLAAHQQTLEQFSLDL